MKFPNNARVDPPDLDSDSIGILAEGSAVNLFGKFGGRGMHFVSQIFLARFLGPFSFGLYSIGWNLLRLISMISTLGLEYGLIHFGAKYWRKDALNLNRIIRTSSFLAIGSGLLWGLAFYLLAPQIALAYDKADLVPVLRLISISFPFVAGLKVLSNATRITKRMLYAVIAEEIGQPFSNLMILVIIYLLAGKLIHAVSAGVISFVIGFYLAFRFVNIIFFQSESIFKPSLVYIIDLIKYSLPTAMATLFAAYILMTDRILVGFFLTESDAGLYQAVSITSVFFITVLASFKTILAPIISDAHHKKDYSRMDSVFQLSTRWSIYLVFPIAVLLWMYPERSITALFGQEYANGSIPLVILITSYFIYVAKGPVDLILVMTGNQSLWLKIAGSTLALNIILNLIFIPSLETIGAAISTFTSLLALALISLIFIKRLYSITPFTKSLFKGFLSAIFAAMVLFPLNYTLIASPILDVLARLLISISTFSLSLYLLKLHPTDYEFFRHWRIQFKSKKE